jgi:hypothetical protein
MRLATVLSDSLGLKEHIEAIYENLGLVLDIRIKQLLHNSGHQYCEFIIQVHFGRGFFALFLCSVFVVVVFF